MLARAGDTFHIADCVITKPRYRGLTSTGWGCQGILIDRCPFITAESLLAAQDRVSIALNANANDIKLRDNRASRFRHFAILSGSNNIISGNHFYQGDEKVKRHWAGWNCPDANQHDQHHHEQLCR